MVLEGLLKPRNRLPLTLAVKLGNTGAGVWAGGPLVFTRPEYLFIANYVDHYDDH